MEPLALKRGVLTPVLFIRPIKDKFVEVAWGKQRGIATLPKHINVEQLSFGMPLDVKITSIAKDSLFHQFEARALNIIDRDMLALMHLMYKMSKSASTPRSVGLNELVLAIGKTRIAGTLLGVSKLSSGEKEPYLSVTVGYGNLRAHGRVNASFEKVLEETGKNPEIRMEILSVSPEEHAMGDFAATVFIPGKRGTYAFEIGQKKDDAVPSSAEIITKTLITFPLLKTKEVRFSKIEERIADRLVDQLFDADYKKMARTLCEANEPEKIFGALYKFYILLEPIAGDNKDLFIKEVLNVVADMDLGIIHKIGAFFDTTPTSNRPAKPLPGTAPAVSKEMIMEMVTKIRTLKDDRTVFPEKEMGAVTNTVNLGYKKKYRAAASFLLENFDARAIANTLRSAYFTMKQLMVPDRNEQMYEILKCIGEADKNVLLLVNEHLKSR